MKIWFKDYKLEDMKHFEKNSILSQLGITYTELGDDFIKAKMAVDWRTHQPQGVLHGGASVVLAESLGSTAANLVVDTEKYYCVGLDVNANHLRPASSHFVYGVTKPIHIGRKTQVWEIKITNEEGKMICISRLTMAVIER